MVDRHLKLTGPCATGVRVGTAALRGVLELLLQGSARAVRLRTERRSTAKGPRPGWIDASAASTVQISEGSTLLNINTPTLFEAAPSLFAQTALFPELDPDLPAFDYFVESLVAATSDDGDSALYDRSFLRFLRTNEALFTEAGLNTIELSGGPKIPAVTLQPGVFSKLKTLEQQIPTAQQVRLAGRLDSIRHSDLTFSLVVHGVQVRGVAADSEAHALKEFWGKDVVVGGEAHFTRKGDIQRLDADTIAPASGRDLQLWTELPAPTPANGSAFRQPQGPRSGLNAIFGKWPGDENDAAIKSALEALS